MNDRRDNHSLLWGMTGSGKSTVGARLATRLSRDFHDLDRLVEAAEDATVSEIFARHGEAYFRRIERRILRSVLAQPNPMVIALGGGTLLDEDTRKNAVDQAIVFNLTARVETLADRLEKADDRPLLADAPLLVDRLSSILASRTSQYDMISYQIETDEHSPESIAEFIESQLEHHDHVFHSDPQPPAAEVPR